MKIQRLEENSESSPSFSKTKVTIQKPSSEQDQTLKSEIEQTVSSGSKKTDDKLQKAMNHLIDLSSKYSLGRGYKVSSPVENSRLRLESQVLS